MSEQLKKDDLKRLIQEVVFSIKENNLKWLLTSPSLSTPAESSPKIEK